MTSTVLWPWRALPRIRLAGRFPMGARSQGHVYLGAWHALHQHQYDAELWLGNRHVILRPGDVTLTPAGMASRYALPKPGFHLCVHLWPETARHGGGTARIPLHWRPGLQSAAVTARLRALIDTVRQSQGRGAVARAAGAAAAASLQELLLWMAFASARRSVEATRRGETALRRLVGMLDERFAGPLSVPALAHEAGLSQNYLAHRFRERMGVTIQQYVLNRRLELARHLLSTTDLPIKQIGAEVGMPDAQHFNKQFRRRTGLSPSAARVLDSGRQADAAALRPARGGSPRASTSPGPRAARRA